MNTPKNIAKLLAALFITAALLIGLSARAQDIPPGQVPAPVLDAFNKAFPNAMDVDWELKGTQYEVEFETGLLSTDHEVWYDASGKMLRHVEDLSISDLPAAVSAAIAAEFSGYRVDDAERVTMDGTASYVVELKLKGQPEWKVAYDANGKQLQKAID